MKKLILMVAMVTTSVFVATAQSEVSDSSKLVFVRGKCLNTCGQAYVQARLSVYVEGLSSVETLWSVTWTGNDGSDMVKKNYGLAMKKLKNDMKAMDKAHCLRDYRDAPLQINSEIDLFNGMATGGYRYLKKESYPATSVGIVVMPAITVYTFEKK